MNTSRLTALVQLEAPAGGHTLKILKEKAGHAQIYLRPLQRELSLTPEESTQIQHQTTSQVCFILVHFILVGIDRGKLGACK